MRNQTACLFFFAITTSILFAQKAAKKKPDLKINHTKAQSDLSPTHVKSQSAFEYTFQMGQRRPDSSCLYIKKFNPKGILVENSSPAERIIYTYNDKGKLAEESFYDSSGKNIRYKDHYQYNDNGAQSMKTEYGQRQQKIFSVASTYNSQRQETERAVLDSSGKLQSKLLFSYDSKKNISNENELDSSGKIISKKNYTYSIKNNLTGLTIFKNDTITSKYSYEYNDLGKKIKTLCYNSDGSINYKTVSNYNAKGMPAEETTYQGMGFSKISYQYDSKGNITQELKTSDRNSILTKVIYNYDSKGLLTEEIQYNSFDEPESVIRYYYELYPGSQ
jgi:hypothetical protein